MDSAREQADQKCLFGCLLSINVSTPEANLWGTQKLITSSPWMVQMSFLSSSSVTIPWKAEHNRLISSDPQCLGKAFDWADLKQVAQSSFKSVRLKEAFTRLKHPLGSLTIFRLFVSFGIGFKRMFLLRISSCWFQGCWPVAFVRLGVAILFCFFRAHQLTKKDCSHKNKN